MKTMSAKDVEASFGKFIDTAQRERVVVTKENRPVGVFVPMDDFQDIIWAKEANAAHAEGYLTAEESATRLSSLLNAED